MIDRFPGHLASCGIRTRHDFACTCGGPWSPPAMERVEAEYGGNPYPATAGFRGYEDDTHDDECTQGDGETLKGQYGVLMDSQER